MTGQFSIQLLVQKAKTACSTNGLVLTHIVMPKSAEPQVLAQLVNGVEFRAVTVPIARGESRSKGEKRAEVDGVQLVFSKHMSAGAGPVLCTSPETEIPVYTECPDVRVS